MIFTLPFITGYETCIPRENSERTRKSMCTLYAIATLSVISNVEYYQINNDLQIINSSFEKMH